jgi:hypothetical protein
MEKEMIRYLECEKIAEGMFPGEKIIVCREANGNLRSGFLPEHLIKGNKLEVKVKEIKKEQSLVFANSSHSSDYWFGTPGFYVTNNLLSN